MGSFWFLGQKESGFLLLYILVSLEFRICLYSSIFLINLLFSTSRVEKFLLLMIAA
jgi:hypothetical protein